MITSILLIAIGITVFIQPNAPRLFAAFMFAGLTLCHDHYLSHLDGWSYYGSAALLDLAIILSISGITPVPKMVVDLHKICMVSIVVNLLGWVIWFYYLPPLAYDFAFMVIYMWTLMTFIKRNGENVGGGFTVDRWNSCFRFNWYSRFSHRRQNKSPT